MKPSAPGNGSPVTILDVAGRAGVSIKTVSRVVNGEQRVAESTREKVLEAIRALGYQRNMFARGLRADKSRVFGLLYDNPIGDYPTDVLLGALTHCRESGFHLQVEVLRGRDLPGQTIKFLSETRVDGVMLTPPVCDNMEVIAVLTDFDVPFVRISPNRPRPGECFIAIDDRQAGATLAKCLLDFGHRRIGFIRGIPGHAASRLRYEGYRLALAERAVPFDQQLVLPGKFDFASGLKAAAQLMAMADPPTAIFACNDEMAAGVLSWAHAHGVAVPGTLSVCGFDGGTISRVVWPRLTTCHQPIRALGKAAIGRLIDVSTKAKHEAAPMILPFALVPGCSTGTVPQRRG